MPAIHTPPKTRRVCLAETEDAWRGYLAATRGLEWLRYAEVEAWAWGRLQDKLFEIAVREAA